jgi:YggT family protein
MGQYLATLIQLVVMAISILLIVHALLSFTPLEPWHPVRRTVSQLAEPILRPFRQLIPPTGMFDFSVMIALIVVQVVGQILVSLVRSAF